MAVIVHLVLMIRMDMLVPLQFLRFMGMAVTTAYVVVLVLVLMIMPVAVHMSVLMGMFGPIGMAMGMIMVVAVLVLMAMGMGMIIFHAVSSVDDPAGRDHSRRIERWFPWSRFPKAFLMPVFAYALEHLRLTLDFRKGITLPSHEGRKAPCPGTP